MPKPQSGKILCKEFRLTPYDQCPIVFEENHLKDIVRLIVCEEGTPNGNPKLHYHGYVETTKSETGLRTWLRELSHCTDKSVNGNALFFTRNAHEFTMGYITKHKNVTANVGYQQSQIDEFFSLSDTYRRQKETDRKREYRTRKMELQDVIDIVIKDFQTGVKQISNNYERPAAYDIIEHILDVCQNQNVRFPTRSQMENYVNQILYSALQFRHSVIEYYSRAYR